MKMILIVLFIVIDISIILCLYYLNNNFNNINQIYLEKLNGSSYEDKINDLNYQYSKLIKDISLMVDYDINDYFSLSNTLDNLNNQYNKLLYINSELVNKKEQLSKQNKNLSVTYNELLEEERKKNTFIIGGVPRINQYSMGYPTGCESAALTNLLNYWGVSVSMLAVVNVLPKGDLPYYENNVRYGGNPYLEFVGHPNSWSSFGVYEKPILKVAEFFKTGVIDGTGMSLDNVLNIVKQNRPVMVWVSMNMSIPYVSNSWIYKATGERINWMSGEHALLVIGYNQEQVIVSDSLNGSVRYYDKNIFENRYNIFGKRAIYY